MSFNGSGTFNINTSGQPVVTNTVISSTDFNNLTSDLATGLSTCVLKDGTQATTARIPFASGIGLSNGTVAAPALNFTSDTGCGFYRIGSADIGLAISGSKVWDIMAGSVTLSQDLLFTDATYDIGKSGATRPRDFFLSRNGTIGGLLTINGTKIGGGLLYPTSDSTTALKVTKADGSTSVLVVDTTNKGLGIGGTPASNEALGIYSDQTFTMNGSDGSFFHYSATSAAVLLDMVPASPGLRYQMTANSSGLIFTDVAGTGNFIFRQNSGTITKFQINGNGSGVSVPAANLGDNVAGPTASIANNTSASTHGPSAGALTLYSAAGTAYYLWVDAAAKLRINTAAPTGSSGTPTVSDTAGTIVGTQS